MSQDKRQAVLGLSLPVAGSVCKNPGPISFSSGMSWFLSDDDIMPIQNPDSLSEGYKSAPPPDKTVSKHPTPQTKNTPQPPPPLKLNTAAEAGYKNFLFFGCQFCMATLKVFWKSSYVT
jgi:hypothetical protein